MRIIKRIINWVVGLLDGIVVQQSTLKFRNLWEGHEKIYQICHDKFPIKLELDKWELDYNRHSCRGDKRFQYSLIGVPEVNIFPYLHMGDVLSS